MASTTTKPPSAWPQRLAALWHPVDRAGARLAPWFGLAAYALSLAYLLPHHEPWFDEAQAWLIARDSGFVELLTTTLRYEGHPPLWYWILMLPAKAGLPFASAHVIALVISTAGTALFLWRAPFPWFVRVLVPFTFFPFYQYAVVARSYCLFPLFLYGIAALYPTRYARPLRFTAALGGLALVTAHGALIAGVLFILLMRDLVLRNTGQPLRERLAHAAPSFALFGGVTLFVTAVLYPPADPTQSHVLTFGSPDLFGLRLVATTNAALAEFIPLTVLVVATSVALWWRRQVLLPAALPFLVVLAFGAAVYRMIWHDGILYLLWVFGLWLAFDPANHPREAPRRRVLDRYLPGVTLAVAAAVFLLGVSWSAFAYLRDLRYPYTGAVELAEVLAARGLGDEQLYIAITANDQPTIQLYLPVAVQPYAEHNLFVNFGPPDAPAYIHHGRLAEALADRRSSLPSDSIAAIVYPRLGWDAHTATPPAFPGYTLAASTRGHLVWKNRYWSRDAYYLYVRNAP